MIRHRYTKNALKLLFVAGLLYFLSQKGMISVAETKKAFTQWQVMVPALALLFFNFFLGAIRWQWLLRAQGIQLTWRRTLQLTLIGNFFNIALPGAVSGDLVKAYYIGRETDVRRGFAFGSILFDRVAGLSALVLVSAGAMALGFFIDMDVGLFRAIKTFVLIAATCVILFFGYLFLIREHHDPLLIFLRALQRKFAKADSFVKIYEGLRHYHNHRLTVVKVLGISIIVHLIVGWCCYQFAVALGETQLHLLPVYIVTPLGLLVTAIPIAPAGVGTGHAAFATFFKLLGSLRGGDVFTIFALCNITIGAIGGVVYLRFKTAQAEKSAEAARPVPLT